MKKSDANQTELGTSTLPDASPHSIAPSSRPSRPDGDIELDATMASAASLPALPSERSQQSASSTSGNPVITQRDRGALPPAIEMVAEPAGVMQMSQDFSIQRLASMPADIQAALKRSLKPKVIDDELPRGATIGRYIVLSCLGAGGMGVVYAAYDPELDRKVAIKLLRPSSGGSSNTGQGRVRLLREAQAMAKLTHPQVISVYDVGTLNEQVFIAMEFVDGGTLTNWLDNETRTLREIIGIFTLAGRGLQAAHSAGLVHRDFKPDNVLVGKDGRVRVMDFGLARSVGQGEEQAPDDNQQAPSATSAGALALRLTRTGAMMGTPRYMAPEQYEGTETDPRTDQFSFCVALYEAVYRVPPFAGNTLATLGYNVCHGKVLSAPGDSKVPAWVRSVLLRGLSVRPSDRYPNMETLLQALNPQQSKRSRPLLLVGGLVVLALGANVGSQLIQKRKLALCEGAESKLTGIWTPERKETIKTALLSTGKAFAPDVWQRVEQLLDNYTHDWVTMRTESCIATLRGNQNQYVLGLRTQCLDRRLEELSALTGIISKPDATVVEQAVAASSDLPDISACANIEALQAPTPLPENPAARARVEKLNHQLAEIRAGQRFGKYSEVRIQAEAAVRTATELKYQPAEAEALYLLGDIQERSGVAEQAEPTLLKAAVAAMESRQQTLLAQTWILLTQVTGFRLSRYDKAQGWAQLAEAALEHISQPDALRGQLLLARCMTESQAKNTAAAVDFCEKALTLRRKLFGQVSFESSEVINIMAGIYRRSEQFDRAMDLYKEALDIEIKEVGSLHPNVLSTLRGMGIVRRYQRKYDEAVTYFKRALETSQASLGPKHIRSTDYQLQIAVTLLNARKLDEAEQYARACTTLRDGNSGVGTEPDRQPEAHFFLGEILARQGRYEEALTHHRTALELREKSKDRREDKVAYSLTSIGEVLTELGKPRDALPYLERALNFRESRTPVERQDHANLGRSNFSLAKALWKAGRPEQKKRAAELLKKAHTQYEIYGPWPENELPSVLQWQQLVSGKRKPGDPIAPADTGTETIQPSVPTAPAAASG